MQFITMAETQDMYVKQPFNRHKMNETARKKINCLYIDEMQQSIGNIKWHIITKQ